MTIKSKLTLIAVTLCMGLSLTIQAAVPPKTPAQGAQITITQNNAPNLETPITLNLRDADVRDVFRLIAEQNNINLIVSPAIQGTITLRLSHVTLREALSVLLDSCDAVMEQSGSIFRVFPRAEKIEQKPQPVKTEDLQTEIFSINYSDGNEVLSVVNDFLSPNGRARIFKKGTTSSDDDDSSSNDDDSSSDRAMLIVQDFPERLDAIRALLKKIDTETRQVMIDAKIIETTLSNEQILGTDWSAAASLKGSPIKLDTRYAQSGGINYGTLSLDGFNAIYQRLATVGNTNTLSDAKLAVLDGETAHIQVGEVIPVGISTVGASAGGSVALGTTGVQSWNTGITIDISPIVLDNGVIKLEISPDISEVTGYSSLSNSSTAPITNTRNVKTQILIRSGETVVIGGLIKDAQVDRRNELPVLSKLPLVGSLFRRKENTNHKTNLIIFITARLIDLKVPVDEPTAHNDSMPPAPAGDPAINSFLEYR